MACNLSAHHLKCGSANILILQVETGGGTKERVVFISVNISHLKFESLSELVFSTFPGVAEARYAYLEDKLTDFRGTCLK